MAGRLEPPAGMMDVSPYCDATTISAAGALTVGDATSVAGIMRASAAAGATLSSPCQWCQRCPSRMMHPVVVNTVIIQAMNIFFICTPFVACNLRPGRYIYKSGQGTNVAQKIPRSATIVRVICAMQQPQKGMPGRNRT